MRIPLILSLAALSTGALVSATAAASAGSNWSVHSGYSRYGMTRTVTHSGMHRGYGGWTRGYAAGYRGWHGGYRRYGYGVAAGAAVGYAAGTYATGRYGYGYGYTGPATTVYSVPRTVYTPVTQTQVVPVTTYQTVQRTVVVPQTVYQQYQRTCGCQDVPLGTAGYGGYGYGGYLSGGYPPTLGVVYNRPGLFTSDP